MSKTVDELIAGLLEKRQEPINKLADELIMEETTFQKSVAKKKSAPHNQRPPTD